MSITLTTQTNFVDNVSHINHCIIAAIHTIANILYQTPIVLKATTVVTNQSAGNGKTICRKIPIRSGKIGRLRPRKTESVTNSIPYAHVMKAAATPS